MDTAEFFAKLRHLRTTIAGALTIAGSLLMFIATWVEKKTVPPIEQWEILGGALTVGAGLIASADAKTVNVETAKIKEAVAAQAEPPQ